MGDIMNDKEQKVFIEYCNLRMDWDKQRTLKYLYDKYRREFNQEEINKIVNQNEIHM